MGPAFISPGDRVRRGQVVAVCLRVDSGGIGVDGRPRFVCWLQWVFLLLVIWLPACSGILGIEERRLDLAELTPDGYEGCEPENGICDACTSEWHTCICEGWRDYRDEEEKLRAECASKAPEQIREEQEELWSEFLDDDADDADDSTDDADDSSDNSTDDDADDSTDDDVDAGDNDPPALNFCDGDRDACLECFCTECDAEIADCSDDPDCAEILTCVMEAECDPLDGPETCPDAASCDALIARSSDPTFFRFQDTLDCVFNQGCPCGGPEPVACSPGDGCFDCPDCYEQCRCEGFGDAQCQNECYADCQPRTGCANCNDCMGNCLCLNNGDQAYCNSQCPPPMPCSPQGGCDCADCHMACTCQGNTRQFCDSQCPPPPACTPQGGCSCGTCFDSCICQGGDSAYCSNQCNPVPCSVDDACAGCATCFDACVCEGNSTSYCNAQCSAPCSVDDACAGCASCYDTCLCQGNPDTYCDSLCNPVPCSVDDACAGCNSCFDTCVCQGNDDVYCDSLCNPTPCSAGDACAGCNNCYEACLCQGNSAAVCDATCLTAEPCSVIDGCSSCFSGFAKCMCNRDGKFWECARDFGVASCSDTSCSDCGNCVSACDCNGNEPSLCVSQCVTNDCNLTFTSPCDQCACQNCPLEFSACDETIGCPPLAGCMARTGCTSVSDCNLPETCQFEISQMGGIDSPGVAVAEALNRCRKEDAACQCDGGGQMMHDRLCGSTQCYGFYPPPPEPILPACCLGPAADECGVSMDPAIGPATGCALLGEPGGVCANCPSYFATGSPWQPGEELPGCCRPDGTCGYQDTTVGLGCFEPRFVGDTAAPTLCDPNCP